MSVYKDAGQLYELLGELFEEIRSDPAIGPKLTASGLIVRFIYHEPEAEIWMDGHLKDPDKAEIICGNPNDREAEVTMEMSADTAHKFWLGNLNLMVALTRKQITAKGPIPKIMKLLPVIKPAYGMYRELLKSKGLEDLIPDK